MKTGFDDRDFRASHDPVEDRLPSYRQVLIALAVLALIGIHWMPVIAYLDGADPATVGESIFEMWGLFALIVVGGSLIVAVTMAVGLALGRIFTAITDAAGGWPAAEDDDTAAFEAEENKGNRRGPEGRP